MFKLATVALTAVVGAAGIAASVPAEAHPYITVGVGLPGVVIEPFAYAPRYYAPYASVRGPYGRYWHRDYDRGYDRDRYEHFHRRWDHDGGRR
jgi:hypothetical protein